MRYNSTSSALREIRDEMNHDSHEPSPFPPPADRCMKKPTDAATRRPRAEKRKRRRVCNLILNYS